MNMIQSVLSKCDERHSSRCNQCEECSYKDCCPNDCEKCLDYIHFPKHSPKEAIDRQYDCRNMADVYTCKYACRYTSEIIYALRRFKDLMNKRHIRVLSFGCGPCTDLFAIDYLRRNNEMNYQSIEYRGIDYGENVWRDVHNDIKMFENNYCKIIFYYEDMCEIIHKISQGTWTPNLIVFQYVFSDMQKHTGKKGTIDFINSFSKYYNDKVTPDTYMILNDVNLGNNYGGGRDYFDKLYERLDGSVMRKGRFCNENSNNTFYPRGYIYGEDSDGEFPNNSNIFNLEALQKYSPFDACASAQMLIKKRT